MYKLLLVDDNEYVLDGFREKINLGDLGIELAGVAANGEDALELIGSLDPDILITDIKMPKMDGMELIEAVRKMGKEVKVVILSGYSDFEYARKAVSLNAVEYLLKPILKADIENTLRKIIESLKNKETETLRQIRLEVQNRQNTEIVKSHIISSLLEGKMENLQQVRALLAGVDADLLECRGIAVLLEPYCDGHAGGLSAAEKRDAISDALATAAAAAGPGCIGILIDDRRAALVLLYGRAMLDSSVAESCAETLRRILESVRRRHGFSLSISAGQIVDNILDIRQSRLQANEAMKYRLILGRGSAILYSDVVKLHGSNGSRFAQSAKKAVDAIQKGVRDEIFAAIDEFYAGIADHRDCKPADVVNTSYKLALSSADFLRGRDAGISESALWDQLNALETLEEVRVWMKGIFLGAFQAAECRSQYSRIVNLVVDAIEKNYARELLLKDIAKELYISENYLTTLFRKEIGTSFKKYLTNVRMGKAMELLQNPQYKVYEIAGLIGYESEEHFCRMFKESIGLTPKEYKNGGMQPKPSPAQR